MSSICVSVAQWLEHKVVHTIYRTMHQTRHELSTSKQAIRHDEVLFMVCLIVEKKRKEKRNTIIAMSDINGMETLFMAIQYIIRPPKGNKKKSIWNKSRSKTILWILMFKKWSKLAIVVSNYGNKQLKLKARTSTLFCVGRQFRVNIIWWE